MDKFNTTKLANVKPYQQPPSPQTPGSSGVQEFKNPFKENRPIGNSLDLTIEGALAERVAKGDKNATKALVKSRIRRGQKIRTQPVAPTELKDFEFTAPTPAEEDAQLAQKAKYYVDEMTAEDKEAEAGKEFEKVTTINDVRVPSFGLTIPGSGVVLSTFYRGILKSVTNTVGEVGAAYQDIGSGVEGAATAIEGQSLEQNDPLRDFKSFGEFLSATSKDVALGIQGYEKRRPKASKHWTERTVEMLGETAASLPKIILMAKAMGAPAAFGVDRALSARAQGIADPETLTAEFAQGVAEGALLGQLGKTAEWIDKLQGRGVVTKILKAAPKTTQILAQGVGGAGQLAVDQVIHPQQPKADLLDFAFSAGTNMLLDPVLFGAGERSQRVTDNVMAADRATFKGANLSLPELQPVRPDFWTSVPSEDIPLDTNAIKGLLENSRLQIDSDAGVLYVNPSAGVLVARAFEAMDGRSGSMNKAAGTMLTSDQAMGIGFVFERQAERIKQFIDQTGDPSKNPEQIKTFLEAAVRYEAMAEHFNLMAEQGPTVAIRFAQAPTITDPSNEVAQKYNQTVVGHEQFHAQQEKVAQAIGRNLYTLTEPTWLLQHPIGAKLVSEMDNPNNPLRLYDNPGYWTSEAMAYVAQPGEMPALGLSVRERGVLLGDYFSHLAAVHGSDVVAKVDASWIDRDVAQVAFERMAAGNLVRVSKDYQGKPVGLIWNKLKPVRTMVFDGMEMSPALASKQVDPSYAAVSEKLRAPHDLGFVYKSGEVIDRSMKGPMTGGQLLGMLMNAKLRQGELIWTGLGDWLREKGEAKVTKEEVADFLQRADIGIREVESEDKSYATFTHLGEGLDKDKYKELLFTYDNPENLYQSVHFKKFPNILAHARTIDTVAPDGSKVLFIEEMQSDWFQEGAKKGFYPKMSPEQEQVKTATLAELDKLVSSLETNKSLVDNAANVTALMALQETMVGSNLTDVYLKYMTRAEKAFRANAETLIKQDIFKLSAEERSKHQENLASYWELINSFVEIHTRLIPLEKEAKIKSGPLSTSWPEFVLRRLVKKAVDDGYDSMEFITGQESATIVGGKSHWFYDRDIPKMAKKIFEPLGAKIEPVMDFEKFTSGVEKQLVEDYMAVVSPKGVGDFEKTRLANENFAATNAQLKNFGYVLPELDENGFTENLPKATSITQEKRKERVLAVIGRVANLENILMPKITQNSTPELYLETAERFYKEALADAANYGLLDESGKLINLPGIEFDSNFFASYKGRLSIKLTPEFKEAIKSTPQQLPFNLEVDPTLVNEVNDAGTKAVDTVVKDGAIIFNETSATDEAKQRYYDLHQEHLELNKEVRALTSRIKAGVANLRYAKELQNAGLDMVEQISAITNEVQQNQLARRESQRKLTASKLAVDSFWTEITEAVRANRESLVGRVRDERTASYEDRIRRAVEDVKRGTVTIETSDPLYEEVMALKTFRDIGQLGRDIMIANNITPLDSQEKSLHRQFFDAITSGLIDVKKVDDELQRRGTSLEKLLTDFTKAGTTFGKGLNILSQMRKDLNKTFNNSPAEMEVALKKLFKDMPEVEAWFKGTVPTVAELKKIARGRNNAMRFLGLRTSAMLLNLGTQVNNAVQGGIAAGNRTLFNVAENVMQRISSGEYEVILPDGSAETREMEIPSLGSSFRPLLELASVASYSAKQLVKGDVSWLDSGVRKVGRPDETYARSVGLLESVMKAFPDVRGKMITSLEADFEAMDLEASQNALTVMERQVLLMPEGDRKRRLVEEIKAAKTRLETESGWLSEKLRGAEGVMHKAMIIGRGPERVLRTAIFAGQLDYYAQKYGQNIWQLNDEGRAHEIHPEAVGRAMHDALEATFGLQADKSARTGTVEKMTADYMAFLRQGDNVWSLALNAVQPFQNFIIQFSRYSFQTSPLALARYMKLLTPSGRESLLTGDGNYDRLAKAIVGTTAWAAAYATVKSKYDDLEKTGKPPEHPEWDSIAGTGVSAKGTLWGPMFFVADQIERKRKGLPSATKDVVEWLGNIGPDFKGVAGSFDWLDSLHKDLFSEGGELKDKTIEGTAKALGAWLAAFETPFRNFTDFMGEFDEDQRTLKDLNGWGWGSFVTPMIDKLPTGVTVGGRRLKGREMLDDRIDLFTGRPMMKNHPASRALTGFSLLPEQSYPARVMAQAGIKYGDWVPYTGVPEVDKELSKEIGRRAQKVTDVISNTSITDKPFEQQVNIIYQRYRELALEAKADVLSKFPDVEAEMEHKKELNKWERRVLDRTRELNGVEPIDEVWKRIKERRQERQRQQQ